MQPLKSKLHDADLSGKRVLLRADLNVPLKNGTILSDERLKALLPTLRLILEKGGKIILMTHIDRPEKFDPNLSTKILLPWFAQQGFTITFESDLNRAYEKSFHDPKTILLIDNLRFYPGEKSGDGQFAQSLARLGDMYVNDAFGMIHRTDASVLAVAQLFAPEKRMFGLLIEQELQQANLLLHNPEHPFVLIIGGNKIKDKMPLIEHLLSKVDTILLCPALVFSYLKTHNQPVGSSLVDPSSFDQCIKLEQQAKKQKVAIVVPVDYLVSTGTFKGPYSIKKASELSNGDYGISIGPETATIFASIIKESKTCLYNGLMGDVATPESLQETKTIFEAMAQSKGFSAIGGGDSSAAAQILGLADRISYLSTGGGALIAYLSGQEMPALALLINRAKS